MDLMSKGRLCKATLQGLVSSASQRKGFCRTCLLKFKTIQSTEFPYVTAIPLAQTDFAQAFR